MLASSMYGKQPLATILPEMEKLGVSDLDIWPRPHGNQREQITKMGLAPFGALLEEHRCRLSCLTHYDLGPYGLAPEMPVAQRFGCRLMVCGGRGPAGLNGESLKQAVKTFAENMRPHLEEARKYGVSIAIENHGHNLINTPDSLKWLMEFRSDDSLKIALAPYHLEHGGLDAAGLGRLIEALGNDIAIFYAWQYGMGCMQKLPKEQELLQMPGRGDLDFMPALRALKKVHFQGFTEVFMHPVPRGIPILPTTAETTKEINRGRDYLEASLKRLPV